MVSVSFRQMQSHTYLILSTFLMEYKPKEKKQPRYETDCSTVALGATPRPTAIRDHSTPHGHQGPLHAPWPSGTTPRPTAIRDLSTAIRDRSMAIRDYSTPHGHEGPLHGHQGPLQAPRPSGTTPSPTAIRDHSKPHGHQGPLLVVIPITQRLMLVTIPITQ